MYIIAGIMFFPLSLIIYQFTLILKLTINKKSVLLNADDVLLYCTFVKWKQRMRVFNPLNNLKKLWIRKLSLCM